MSWLFEDDICWCGDSDTCENKECFRHLDNRTVKEGIYTISCLRHTDICPLNKEEGEKFQ